MYGREIDSNKSYLILEAKHNLEYSSKFFAKRPKKIQKEKYKSKIIQNYPKIICSFSQPYSEADRACTAKN